MNFEEIGKWKGYPVLLGGSTRPFPHDNRIYLSPTDFGYNMYLNNVYVGWCDAKYRVQEYTEPEPKRTSTFTASWTDYPKPKWNTKKPEQKTNEPEPQPVKKETTPPPVSTDFWSSLQEDILSTLNGVKLVDEKTPKTEPKPTPKSSSKPLFRFDFQ